MFGRKRHRSPPPINKAATMNVGAGQYVSNNVAITIFPIIPPNRAATIDIAIPVALNEKNRTILIYFTLNEKTSYLKLVGNISVIRQSRAAFPQEITPLNIAEMTKFCVLFTTKYIQAEHIPEVTVLKTERNAFLTICFTLNIVNLCLKESFDFFQAESNKIS